jgi:[acyl-carrier-protein] S-malonyltransferase
MLSCIAPGPASLNTGAASRGNGTRGEYMGKLAFVLGVIGYNDVGMGQDLHGAFPEFKAVFDEVSDLTGLNIARLCFEGPAERLSTFAQGTFAQFAMSLGCHRVLSLRGIEPDYFCGMCEGQAMSWVAAEALDMASAIAVCQRAVELINQAPLGLMARILGLELEVVQDICCQASRHGVIDVAIIMGPGAVSVSGEPRAIKAALALAHEAGAQEARPIGAEARPVHCRLLEPAVEELVSSMSHLAFHDPKIPIVSAIGSQPKQKAEELLAGFARELASTLAWQQAIQWLTEHSVDAFVSLGLAQGELVRLANEQATSLYIYDVPTLNSTLAFLQNHSILEQLPGV